MAAATLYGEASFPMPAALHADTQVLVQRFAAAIATKLRQAEVKYGFSNGWLTEDWENECRRQLNLHLGKGDPLDVAIYSAFMWARSWSVVAMAATPADERTARGQELYLALEQVCLGIDVQIVGDALVALTGRSISQRVRTIEAAEAIADATALDIKRALDANWNEAERKWR